MDINARLIKDKRTAKNWTQQHLADACDLSLRTIQRVERYGSASNETVAALAAVLEIDQSEIIIGQATIEAPNEVEEKTTNPWIERLVVASFSMLVGFGIALFVVQ